MLHQAKTIAKVIFPSDAIVQACTFIVETLTHFVLARPQLVGGLGFHLNCNLLHLKTVSKICTKRFMGPGETRRSRHKRDVNCGLIKNINGTKSKLSIKINSAVVKLHYAPPLCL